MFVKLSMAIASSQGAWNTRKTHGKIANNNNPNFAENNIRLQCLELSNYMLQELIMANKGIE